MYNKVGWGNTCSRPRQDAMPICLGQAESYRRIGSSRNHTSWTFDPVALRSLTIWEGRSLV